jgi:hypothetical protein
LMPLCILRRIKQSLLILYLFVYLRQGLTL